MVRVLNLKIFFYIILRSNCPCAVNKYCYNVNINILYIIIKIFAYKITMKY